GWLPPETGRRGAEERVVEVGDAIFRGRVPPERVAWSCCAVPSRRWSGAFSGHTSAPGGHAAFDGDPEAAHASVQRLAAEAELRGGAADHALGGREGLFDLPALRIRRVRGRRRTAEGGRDVALGARRERRL